MKIKITIADIIVEINRPSFVDYSSVETGQGHDLRVNIMNDTVLPLLKETVASAIQLYNVKNKDESTL